ncbi:MAG TPA: iron ABC transporter permease [Gemmatimonadaceae bacterium]|nr:iron ABC transporter permease [Gemmatimonadaceae bacterium]
MSRVHIRWIAAAAALVALAILSVGMGSVPLPPAAVLDAVAGRGDPTAVTIVRVLRVPRVVLALLLGAGLGMSGASLQGVMRNPLAEPYLLGVSGGAAVGAVIAVALGAAAGLVPVAAFIGAVAAVTVAFAVARATPGRGDARVLLMAGVIVGAFANAAIMLLLANADPSTMRGALWWMMGSVGGATWTQIAWLALYVVAGGGLLVAWAREIDILALGEDAAAGLGLDADRASRRVYLVASLVAAATVAAAGLVGFVGLVVPHIARRLGAGAHRGVILGSALVGAGLVVAADLVARIALPPAELPLGAVTAVIGVPFFLVQLRRLR